MNGKFLLITVLSLATLCLAGPAFKTGQDGLGNELNSIQDKINYEQKQFNSNNNNNNIKANYKQGASDSNKVEDILARWCQSSADKSMPAEILTESFKQLTGSLKQASKRQLEQLTDEIIISGRFCQQHQSQSQTQSQTQTGSESFDQYESEAQQEYIKDVYLDALVACDSSEAVEQLVRAIDSGKVDKIRSNYYLTLLAITTTTSDSSDFSTSTSDMAQKLSQSFARATQTGSGNNNNNKLIEAIERQKMFAATAAWSKKLERQQEQHQQQQHQGTTYKVPAIYKQQVEQLVEAIFERYIWSPNTKMSSGNGSGSQKSMAERQAALKALANIPCYAMPARQVDYLVQLALNKQEQTSARQSAIEALTDCSPEQAPQLDEQLKQLALYQTEEPIEVRIAAYRHIATVSHDKHQQQQSKFVAHLDELVKFIKEEQRERQDTQFVAYVVSHLTNLVKPSKTGTGNNKSLYEEIKASQPQLLAQIRVVAKRMENAGYADMRKYSRNYQLEQSLARMDTGLMLDADVIYSKHELLPKVLRLNVSMPVNGKQDVVELVEITVRQNRMEREFLHVLKPLQQSGAKVNMDTLENVVSGFKKVAAASQQQQQQQQQSNQQAEADLAIKVDGCTVVYVSLDDFKLEQNQKQKQNQKQNTRSPRSISGSGRFHQTGSKHYDSLEEVSIVEQLLELLKKNQIVNRGLHFHMERRLGGLIDLQTVLTGSVRAQSRVRSLGRTQPNQAEVHELVARFEPRLAFETVWGLASKTGSGSGSKKLIQRVASESSLGLRVKYQEEQLLEVLLELPQQEEMELFKVESQLVEQIGTSASGLPIYRYGAGRLSPSKKQNVVDYYGNQVGDTTEDGDDYNKQTYTKVMELPQAISKLTGMRGKFEIVTAPKHLSGMMRLVVKKTDPKMTGYRMLIQSDSATGSGSGNSGKYQNGAYTIALSTPIQYGQEQQQERLVQLRFIRAETSEMSSIKGELITPMSEPMRFMLAYKDDGRQQALEGQFKCGKSEGAKFEIGYQKPASQQMSKRSDQYIYKPYLRVQMADRQPIEMSALVQVVRTPKTSVQYEIQVPQEFVSLIAAGGYRAQKRQANQENKIKGKLTLVANSNNNKWSSSKARRDMKSGSEQLINMIDSTDVVMTNDLDVQVGRVSLKALTHFGFKPQDQHLVMSNNVDYAIVESGTSDKVDQSRFDLELKNQDEHEDQQQIVYINHSSSKYPQSDFTVKFAHKQTGKKHQLLARYQYPTRAYERMIKTSHKLLSMEERLNEMGRIEYSHELEYYNVKQMQLIAQLFVSPLKFERKIQFQIQSERQQTGARIATKANSYNNDDESIKAQIVIVDKVSQREDLNAYVKFDKIQSQQQIKQYNVQMKADLDNKKHQIEVRHDCQHQVSDKLVKNMFRMSVDKQTTTTFDYQIRQQQQAGSGKFDYLLEGQWRDAQTSQRPVQVRSRTQFSMVEGFEFEHQFECPEKQMSSVIVLSEPKKLAKIEMKSIDFQLSHTNDYKLKQMQLAVQYRPARFQHQTRVQYDSRQQVVVIESEQVKYERQQYRIKSQLASPIDLDYLGAQYERFYQSGSGTSKRPMSSKQQQQKTGRYYEKKSQTYMTIGEMKKMIKLNKQPQPVSYIKGELAQQQVKFSLELVPQEERLQLVLADDLNAIYHKTLIETGSGSAKLVIKSETKTDKDSQQQVYLIDAYVGEQEAKMKVLVPRLYNMEMDYDIERRKLVAYVKKGAKFERTLEASRNWWKNVERLVSVMDKMESQKVMIDAQQYPQIKVAYEMNESPVKKLVVFGADIWANSKHNPQSKWSSMAMQAGRYSGETKWQQQASEKLMRIQSELKDLYKKERYALQGELAHHTTNHKSYLNMDTPTLQGQWEYEPQEESAKLHLQGKQQNGATSASGSFKPFEFESRLERAPIGSTGRFVRRALVNYEDPDEQHRHSFEFNPIGENVKLSSERKPIGTKYSTLKPAKHFWSMEANVNSHRRPWLSSTGESYDRQLEGKQFASTDFERSYLKMKHNNDLEAEFEMRPFAESVRTRKTQRNEQHDDDQQDQEQFARFAIKSRSPRSVYEHETSVSKDIKSGNYKAWMKHLSGAELKALFEAEIKSRKPSRGRYSKKSSDEEDNDSEWSYDHEAKLQARSDKHGRAQWEHKWSGKSKKEPKVRDDKVSFDLDLSDKWNQFKHQSQFEMRRPFDWSSHGKRDRRSIYTQSDEPTFEYIKEKLSQMNPNKIDARMSTKTSYKSQPIYQIEADWNQMYNSNTNTKTNSNTKSQLTPKANQFKVNALQYKTEFEYQPMSHAHLQVIKPNQERHLVHYEHPIANVHRFNSRQVSPKGQDMYKFEAQVPTSFDQYEFHPFGQQQQVRTIRNKQPASTTRIVYEDRQGKKMNLEFDLARQLRQKRASILLQDPKRGYEHHTKWAYTTASGLEADNISTKGKLLEPNYFKTETKSTRLGQLISFDIEARDSKQVLIRFDTPLVRGEISGERPQRHQQQLRVKLQNQQQQKSRLSKFIELPEQFYHDTELLINERDQYYKLKSQTVVDQQQLVELMLALNNAGGQQLGQFKLATRGSQVEIKLDQQLQRVDLHVDYDEKRLQQDTMIHLKDAQRQVYAIESITRYQQQPMLDIHGELCYDQVRCQEKKTKLEGQFASTSGEHQYKYQLAYDPMIKAAAMLINDPLRQEVHELQLSYDESKDAINANYVRKTTATTGNGTTGNGATNQVVLVRGEARLSMRDLMGKFYDVEYLDTRRHSTSQQAPMVSEIVLEVAPEWREQQRSFRISYEPKKSLELNYSDEPNKFQHHTRISFPLAASQKKDAYTQDFGLLMRQIRLESRQQYQNQLATYTTRVPIISYQLSFDYDLERESQLKFDSPQTSLVFEVRPGDKFTKTGQLILASTRINHQSKFDFDLTTKRLMIKSSTKDKLAAINYEMEADLSGSRKQPSLVVIRSPKYHYRMESDILSGFPTLQMNLEQPDKMLRHEFLYRPMEGAYRRHQLKLASGRLAGQGAQSQWHSIDYSAPTSSLLDISFDRDNQQESYVRVASGQRDFYGQLQYQPSEESELRVKYGRPSEKFEHDTIVSHFNRQGTNYPRVFKSQATRQGQTLYQVYGDARLNKQSGNSRHALGYESHGYEVRATMDPRTHEISMEVTTPDNKRQRTELVMPSRLQPQYQVKSSLKTQEGVEIYSMESAYSGATRKMTIQYRQYQPNKQYQMEWDGKLKRGHIQSEHLQMEIKPTEALIKYQPTTSSQQVWTGVVRYALIKPTSGYKIATSNLLVVEAKFQKSTGEELHVDMERQLGHKAKVVVKVLNRQQKIDLIASAQADLLANTISMKVDYDQEKFEKFARQLIASADRHSNRHLYQFLQHQLVLEDGQQVSQYKVKEVGQLVEQVYRQVKEECARINHQRQYPASQKYSMGAYEKAKVTSCQLVEEYLQELEGAVVRTSDKFMVKLEQLYDQVPIVKQLVKVYDESRDLINKLVEHIIKAANNNNNTNTNNTSNSNTKYSDDDQSYDTYNSNYVASVKSNATKLAKIILDPAMYQSHNSRFAMRPGYLAMELAPEKELNLIRGVMAY